LSYLPPISRAFAGGEYKLDSGERAPLSTLIAARVRGNPEPYLAICRDAVQRTGRNVPVYDVKTPDQRLAGGAAGLGRSLRHPMASAEPAGIRMCGVAAIAIAAATSRIVRTLPAAALRVE
jgi:hypothetical protein